ncbi:MAG: O-antigen ligase family protein [Nitrospinota bacterium]
MVSVSNLSMFVLGVIILNACSFFSPVLNSPELDFEASKAISSDAQNRITWIFLFVVSLFIVKRTFSNWFYLVVKTWPLFLLICYATLSFIWSEYSKLALLRVSQQILVYFCLTASLSGISTKKQLMSVFVFCALLLVGVEFLAFISMTSMTDLGFRGIHSHKNTAGIVLSFCFLSLYCFQSQLEGNLRKAARFCLVLSLVMLFITMSKTAIFLTLVSCIIYSFLVLRLNVSASKILFSIFFLCTFLFSAILSFGLDYLSELGVTFTGRLFVWLFVLDEMSGHWLNGVGFGSFWNLGELSRNILYGGDFGVFLPQLSQGHNSYLDILITLGIIGLFLLFVYLYHTFGNVTTFLGNDTTAISAFLFVHVFFFLVHSFMESTILRGYNLFWILFITASLIAAQSFEGENQVDEN